MSISKVSPEPWEIALENGVVIIRQAREEIECCSPICILGPIKLGTRFVEYLGDCLGPRYHIHCAEQRGMVPLEDKKTQVERVFEIMEAAGL